MTSTTLIKNYHQILQRINTQNTQNIQLIAVSKTKPASMIEELHHSTNHQHFGENYIQEGVEKIEQLRELPLIWHFIGSLQSNKSKIIAQHFHWIHTIDSLDLCQKIIKQLIKLNRPAMNLPPLQACLQINIDHQLTKAGFLIENEQSPQELLDFFQKIEQWFEQNISETISETIKSNKLKSSNNLTQSTKLSTRLSDYIVFRGLMVIPDPLKNKEGESFIRTQTIFKHLQKVIPSFDTLSMGMSQDLELAIQHGATCVRIGSDLFGSR